MTRFGTAVAVLGTKILTAVRTGLRSSWYSDLEMLAMRVRILAELRRLGTLLCCRSNGWSVVPVLPVRLTMTLDRRRCRPPAPARCCTRASLGPVVVPYVTVADRLPLNSRRRRSARRSVSSASAAASADSFCLSCSAQCTLHTSSHCVTRTAVKLS